MSKKLALTLLAGVALGAAAVHGLHAQATPPVLYVVDISEVKGAAAFAAVAGRSNAAAGERLKRLGGRYVARTDKITAVDGTPPKRLIIIAFDNMEKAKAFSSEPGHHVARLLRRGHVANADRDHRAAALARRPGDDAYGVTSCSSPGSPACASRRDRRRPCGSSRARRNRSRAARRGRHRSRPAAASS